MNKKSIRNKTSQPVQKTLPAAVHAAAMSLDGETAGGSTPPLVADGVHTHDMSELDMQDTPPPADTGVAMDGAADATDPGAGKPAKSRSAGRARKTEKPGKPVKISLTLPAGEAQLFDALRQTYQADGARLKKSVLLRAALLVLAESDEGRVVQILAGLQAPAEDQPGAKRKAKK